MRHWLKPDKPGTRSFRECADLKIWHNGVARRSCSYFIISCACPSTSKRLHSTCNVSCQPSWIHFSYYHFSAVTVSLSNSLPVILYLSLFNSACCSWLSLVSHERDRCSRFPSLVRTIHVWIAWRRSFSLDQMIQPSQIAHRGDLKYIAIA